MLAIEFTLDVSRSIRDNMQQILTFSQELGRLFKLGFEGLERKVDGVSEQVARGFQVRAEFNCFRD